MIFAVEVYMSECDQVRMIDDSIRATVQQFPTHSYPERMYKYLAHVVIAVSDGCTLEESCFPVTSQGFAMSLFKCKKFHSITYLHINTN